MDKKPMTPMEYAQRSSMGQIQRIKQGRKSRSRSPTSYDLREEIQSTPAQQRAEQSQKIADIHAHTAANEAVELLKQKVAAAKGEVERVEMRNQEMKNALMVSEESLKEKKRNLQEAERELQAAVGELLDAEAKKDGKPTGIVGRLNRMTSGLRFPGQAKRQEGAQMGGKKHTRKHKKHAKKHSKKHAKKHAKKITLRYKKA